MSEGQEISIAEIAGKPRPKVPKAAEPPPVLVLDEQASEKVLKAWNDAVKNNQTAPSIEELITIAWGKTYDVRSPQGMAVRTFISNRKPQEPKSEDKIVLNDEQKAYVEVNAFNMSSVDISKILFKNETLGPFHKETRAVFEYLKEINPNRTKYDRADDFTEEGYTAPSSMPQVIARVKKYVPMSRIDSKKLSQREKNAAESLMAYLHTLRFQSQITSFESQRDRELFESEFIRCCYDKSDLTEEEVDQYVVYANEVVISRNIQKSINIFQSKLENDSEDDKKLSLTFIEAIGSMRNEYNASIKRQQDLLKDLKGKRSDRIKERMNDNASILNLVQAWKEKEFRDKTIHLAIKRQEVLKEEIKNLTDMDEIKARIFGISQEEVLNG
jgi:hypothetical protein